MKLSDLMRGLPVRQEHRPGTSVEDPEIGSVHCRAQNVRPGGLFIAVPGFKADGHDFAADAAARGASAILVQRPVAAGGILVETADTRKMMGIVAGRFYRDPSLDLVAVGITGTNGKTTTSYLIESILSCAGFKTGVIGTINYRYAGRCFDNPVTTPESLDLQRILSEMRDHGVTHLVMETSSHALDLHRLEGCWFDVGVFTNLTQDHLDYHGDMETYWACKRKLFTHYLGAGPKKDRAKAVINIRDPKGKELSQTLALPCLTTGWSEESVIRAESPVFELSGISGGILTPAGRFNFSSRLTGAHNLDNILSAAGAGAALGIPLDRIKAGIELLSSVPGRLEVLGDPKGRFVYVDYAHTPDALKNVLSALKPLVRGRLICVFGCGGDRDRKKRPMMGDMAALFADLSVVTSDNPRSEDPDEIIRQILPGFQNKGICEYARQELPAGFNGRGYTVEPNRGSAIRLAIGAARPGDAVLIAGKGHETYQIIGAKRLSFDDRAEARQALEEL
jgi:UDP-N-acetylmuramoyl-L-alanyl-D-glutamate--2,6-diaminopimelate ligase/murE/murF fusion protein